ncbi:MAG: zinc ribbon domain-containing protein [Moraxella sp.]|nr:zinc ribbon domain-containing protein [Moraxella sp.]
MTLFDCPACHRQISKDAVSCPWCGHPIWHGTKNIIKGAGIVGAVIAFGWLIKAVALIAGLVFLYFLLR